jgi:DNA-binding NarL/FixJ family response regulator
MRSRLPEVKPEQTVSGPILVADDHPIFRGGLCHIVGRTFPGTLILEASEWSQVLAAAREGQAPGMFILDLMFPGMDMDHSIRDLRLEFPQSFIVVISMLNDRNVIDRVLQCGADGFIGKDVPPDEVGASLMEICNGGFVVNVSTPAITMRVEKGLPNLTARQSDVLRLLTTGKSNKEIARLLGISPFTVRIHVSSLFKALGVSNRAGAAVRGAELIEPRKG